MPVSHGSPQSVTAVVESLGFGWGQLIVLIVGAGGIMFQEGLALVCFNLITTSAATDLHLSTTEKGMLTTMAFIGLFIGVSSSGYFADVFGRRLPCIISYAMTTMCLLLCSLPQSWSVITVAGMGVGFAAGFGMPPSIAMLSEVSPVSWRMRMRAASSLMYTPGMIYVCVLAGLDDPNLEHLNWRLFLRKSAIPSACLCVLASVFLPESPVFLAAKGLQVDAENGFRLLAQRNGRNIAGAYEFSGSQGQKAMTLSDQLEVIFGHQYLFATAASIYACFTLNVLMYGTMYGNPQIFVTAASLPAAWQMLFTAIPAAAAIIATGVVSGLFSRKALVVFSMFVGSTCMLAMCLGGSHDVPRPWYFEGLFQYGTLFGAVGAAIGFTVLFQLAVEMYPPTSSATGGSLIIGIGRIGAIIAPELFDLMHDRTGSWQVFYSFLGALAAAGLVLWLFVPASIGTGMAKMHQDDDCEKYCHDERCPLLQ